VTSVALGATVGTAGGISVALGATVGTAVGISVALGATVGEGDVGAVTLSMATAVQRRSVVIARSRKEQDAKGVRAVR